MKTLRLPLLFACLLIGPLLFGQSSAIVRDYIERYRDIAILEEIRTGVPAAITLAQGIHETEAGTSDLVKASNNHFGIKCKGDWTGETVYHDDDARGECFRKYADPADSYKDHSDFLRNRPNYAFLFKIDPRDYESWAWGLKKAGYATNPKYPQILIKLIKDYNLQDYTLIALNSKEQGGYTPVWASSKDNGDRSAATSVKMADEVTSSRPAYPSGVFTINETSVVFVPKGTAFLKVAEDNHLSLNRLFEFNDMDPADIASRDQLMYLKRKRRTGANEFHVVASGETLYDIAQEEGIRLQNLLDYNFLKPGMQPDGGEKLYLQRQAPGMPRLAVLHADNTTVSAYAPSEEFILHTVQPKETVYAIAKKYSVEVADVMKWNDLPSMDLKIGQQLRISKKSMNGTN
jgi:LysM repeat protein